MDIVGPLMEHSLPLRMPRMDLSSSRPLLIEMYGPLLSLSLVMPTPYKLPSVSVIDASSLEFIELISFQAFNPRLFFPPDLEPKRATASCMLALGADDFSISIWSNISHIPIVVLHNLFENALMDLCW